MKSWSIPALPYDFQAEEGELALLMIDFQRDFMEQGGFGESLGNDVSFLRSAIAPAAKILAKVRELGLPVIHTREGHRPDLADVWDSKRHRGNPSVRIGDPGPMGRILIRGEKGHDIIPELYPLSTETVVDKPGKGSFYSTDLQTILGQKGIKKLLVCGVTTEVCVHTTVREANDRGLDCLVISDACASYFPDYHKMALEMIQAQGGIFGWVSSSQELLDALGR